MNVAGPFLPSRSQLWFGRASAVVTANRSSRLSPREPRVTSSEETKRVTREAIAGVIDGALEASSALRAALGSIRTRAAATLSRADIGLTSDSGGSSTTGMAPEVDEPMEDVPAFDSVSSGKVLVNGTEVGFNVQRHSLRQILDRIEASGAGVSTGLWAGGERAFIRSDSTRGNLVLDSNGTGLFEALGIREGVHRPHAAAGTSRQQARVASQAFEAFAQALNDVLDSTSRGVPGSRLLDQVHQEIERVVAGAVGGEGPEYELGEGIAFDFSEGATEALDVSGESRVRFEHALLTQGRDASVYSIFLGNPRHGLDGLFDDLVGGLQQILDSAGQDWQPVGSRLDLWL